MKKDEARRDSAARAAAPEEGATVVAVSALMDERRRYESWIAALEARKHLTPQNVFDRVHADYKSRLDAVLAQLTAHADGLRVEMESLSVRLGGLAEERQKAQDERAEAELRAHVGELSPEDWKRTSDASDARLGDLVQRHGHIEEELVRTRELLRDAERPAPPPPVVVAEPISVSKSVEALTRTDKWAEAIPILEKAMVNEPKNADVLVILALAKKKTADIQGAKLLLEKAIVLNPEEPVAHNNLGLVFAALGSWDLAIGSYEKALKLRANYSDAEMNAARAYEATKQWKKAIASYERFLSQSKDNIDLRKKIETRMRRLNSFSINPPKTTAVEGEKI